MKTLFKRKSTLIKSVTWVIVIVSFTASVYNFAYRMYMSRHPGIEIVWSTGSEVDVIGYNILKSDQKEGEYRKINADFLPAKDPFAGGEYQYTDSDIVSQKTYFYKLEAISADGSSEYFGPIESRSENEFGFSFYLSIMIMLVNIAIMSYLFIRRVSASKGGIKV